MDNWNSIADSDLGDQPQHACATGVHSESKIGMSSYIKYTILMHATNQSLLVSNIVIFPNETMCLYIHH